jgi:hypothetical protein
MMGRHFALSRLYRLHVQDCLGEKDFFNWLLSDTEASKYPLHLREFSFKTLGHKGTIEEGELSELVGKLPRLNTLALHQPYVSDTSLARAINVYHNTLKVLGYIFEFKSYTRVQLGEMLGTYKSLEALSITIESMGGSITDGKVDKRFKADFEALAVR